MNYPIIRTHTITYQGQWLSTNTILGLNRFTASKRKDEWKQKLLPSVVAADLTPVEAFSVEITYWSRLDPDNVIGVGVKGLIDLLRGLGVLVNDDKRFWKGLTIHPDPTMKHNHYQILLHVHS